MKYFFTKMFENKKKTLKLQIFFHSLLYEKLMTSDFKKWFNPHKAELKPSKTLTYKYWGFSMESTSY